MAKRYQVFVSSTYEDLKDERQKVITALLLFDIFPSAMEYFNASDDETWTMIKQIIDRCDYYVLILGGIYGSVDKKTGKSFTELEFDYAIERSKPTIAFFPKDLKQLPGGKLESDPARRKKLESFHKKAKAKGCRSYETPDGLGLAVAAGLKRLIEDRPAIGWVPGDQAADPGREVELLSRIAELERQLAITTAKEKRAEVPSSSLALGEKPFTINFGNDEGQRVRTRQFTETINGLFRIVGPAYLSPNHSTGPQTALFDYYDARLIGEGWFLDLRDFHELKLHLFSLGLIETLGTMGNWQLTSFGKSYLADLIKAGVPAAVNGATKT